jgi:UDP-N-acetylmuramoyl-L-alanyl-D-glutamate--2,6-diaminopimelate ligase
MEVSSHALSQNRVSALPFDAAVFTNLTQDHLDYHDSLESYAQAKSQLFASLGYDARAVINTDDAYAQRMLAASRSRILRYGLAKGTDLRARNLAMSPGGTSFRLETPLGACDVRLPLPGRYNVANALAAVGAVLDRGVPLPVIAGALGKFPGVPGRLECVSHGLPFRVFVDYAHTDDALTNVLTALRELKPARILTVFGCGGDRDAAKRPKMGRAAERLSDLVIVTSDNPRTENSAKIIAQILTGMNEPEKRKVVPDRAEAIELAVKLAQEGDIVLIAGKGHEDYQVVGTERLPFDDRIVARQALHRRRAG